MVQSVIRVHEVKLLKISKKYGDSMQIRFEITPDKIVFLRFEMN